MENNTGFFKKLKTKIIRLWNITIFPDMIRNKKEAKRRQRAEAEMRREIEAEARQEAIIELRPQLKEIYKQQELDRMTGKKKKDMMDKLSQGFALKLPVFSSQDKIEGMLNTQNTQYGNNSQQYSQNTQYGNNSQQYSQNMLGGTTFGDTNKLNTLLGNNNHKKKKYKKTTTIPTQNKIDHFENKIKMMLR